MILQQIHSNNPFQSQFFSFILPARTLKKDISNYFVLIHSIKCPLVKKRPMGKWKMGFLSANSVITVLSSGALLPQITRETCIPNEKKIILIASFKRCGVYKQICITWNSLYFNCCWFTEKKFSLNKKSLFCNLYKILFRFILGGKKLRNAGSMEKTKSVMVLRTKFCQRCKTRLNSPHLPLFLISLLWPFILESKKMKWLKNVFKVK